MISVFLLMVGFGLIVVDALEATPAETTEDQLCELLFE